MHSEVNYWRSEYENLRRKKNREIERLKTSQALFADRTWKLLKLLGMKDKDILEYYRYENNRKTYTDQFWLSGGYRELSVPKRHISMGRR